MLHIHTPSHTRPLSAQDTLRELEFQHVGYELMRNGQHDLSRKIFRCPSCYAYGDARMAQNKHAPQCTLAAIMQTYEQKVSPGLGVVMRDIEGSTEAYRHASSAAKQTPAYDPSSILPPQQPQLVKGVSSVSLVMIPDDDVQPPPPEKPALWGSGWGNSLGWRDSDTLNLSLPEKTASFAMNGPMSFTPRAFAWMYFVCVCLGLALRCFPSRLILSDFARLP